MDIDMDIYEVLKDDSGDFVQPGDWERILFEKEHQQARGEFAKEVIADLQRDVDLQADSLLSYQGEFPLISPSDTPTPNQIPNNGFFNSIDHPLLPATWFSDTPASVSDKRVPDWKKGVKATVVNKGPTTMVLKFSGLITTFLVTLFAKDTEPGLNEMPLSKRIKFFTIDSDNTAQSESPTPPSPTADDNSKRRVVSRAATAPETSNIIDFTKRSDWYGDLETKNTLARGDIKLIAVAREIIKVSLSANGTKEREKLFATLRTRIHEMEFFAFLTPDGPNGPNDFAANLIKESKILEINGLPEIFSGSRSEIFPFDIRADAQALCARWMAGDFNPHLMRGVLVSKSVRALYKIQQDYPFKRNSHVFGNNGLVNGQWWPQRRCAVRDGAHGEVEAGIAGQVGAGAFAICIARGGYEDRDNGDIIEYCGTKGKDGVASKGTKYMEETFRKALPLRVLRAANKTSIYAPKLGIRYDGLYQITNCEVLDPKAPMKRFTLERVAGQDPIRYQGVEVRPSSEEIREWQRFRDFLA